MVNCGLWSRFREYKFGFFMRNKSSISLFTKKWHFLTATFVTCGIWKLRPKCSLVKVYMTVFLVARLNPPNVLQISIAKKPREKQISPTFSYFHINNTLLYHFLANWLAHNKKMTEKSVFREAWSPEMTSQLFPVSCFWSCGFVPHQKFNLTLFVPQNTGKENHYRKNFLLY